VYINIYLSSVNTNHNEVNIPYYLKYIQLIKFNWTKANNHCLSVYWL